MIDLLFIFETTSTILDFPEKIKKLLGLMVDIDTTIMNLAKSEFDAGIGLLKSVSNTSILDLRKEYSMQAIPRFYKALTIEENERLVCAHLGLAACYYSLGDLNNGKQRLNDFAESDIIIKGENKLSLSDLINEVVNFKNSNDHMNFFEGIKEMQKMFPFITKHFKFSEEERNKQIREEKFLEESIQLMEGKYQYHSLTTILRRQLRVVQLQKQAHELSR